MRADAVQRPSIGVVAAQARVSVKTVSRVLNDSACVTPQTRERVMRVIQQLNYSPSANARRLSGHRSKLIGLPFDNLYASYVTEVQSGSMRICNAERYQLIMHACESSAATLADEIRRFVQCVRVDGVLLSPPLSDRLDVMEALKQEDIPFVRIAASRRIESSLSVITNDQETARRMTQHLASLGHTRIAFVGSRAPDASSESRLFWTEE